jgi:hypothetical protein
MTLPSHYATAIYMTLPSHYASEIYLTLPKPYEVNGAALKAL